MSKYKQTCQILISFLAATAIFALVPIPSNQDSGLYHLRSGIIWTTPKSELHELAHKADVLSGRVSENSDFQEVAESMALDLWANPMENYASIYSHASGNKEIMPEELREFYDWDLLEELQNKANNPNCYIGNDEWVYIHFLCGANQWLM